MLTLVLLTLFAAPGDGLVPTPFKVEMPIKSVESLPPLDGHPSLEKALGFIARLKDSKRLQTADDVAIFKLVAAYRSGRRKMSLVSHEQGIDGDPRNVMGYGCPSDEFAYSPIQASPQMTAVLLYHELMHVVTCDRLKVRLGTTDMKTVYLHIMREENVCGAEEPAYAAQVRFFAALYDRKRLPKVTSLDPKHGDSGMFPRTFGAWEAIYLGRFCDWLQGTAAGTEENTRQLKVQ